MQTYNISLAGFGGQGILFAGKMLAYAGLMDTCEVSWMPSYGPEMRGGTANCSVVISTDPIGSPLVQQPDVLLAMNKPSLEKFIDAVKPGGSVFVDTTMVDEPVTRTDVNVYEVPATKLAEDAGLAGLANVVMVGKINHELHIVSDEALKAAVPKCVKAKTHMIELNEKALEIGAAQ